VSKSLWGFYGLTEVAGKVGLGKVKRDLAMLFLARCFDRYLAGGGVLGFLIPFTVFKTQAGAGFRRFLASRTRVRVVHDLVTLYPFEGAVNRTAAVVVERVGPNELDMVVRENLRGVEHVVWVNPSKKPVTTDKPLEDVLRETRRHYVVMVPLEAGKPESIWMQLTPKAVDAVRKLLTGPKHYKAHAGVYVGLKQVYYVRIKGRTSDGRLVITNPEEPGQKKSVKQVEAAVEPDLVYPLMRGRDVKKWWVEFKDRYIILPVRQNGYTIPHLEMKTKFPGIYDYFHNFLDELVKRSGEPYKTKLKPYRKSPLQVAEQKAPPFYWVFNAKPSLAPYKVVWKEVSARMKAGGFHTAVLEPTKDLEMKPVIPDHTVVLIPIFNRDEAYYLAGVLNSTIVGVISQYAVVGSLEEYMAVPKFDPNNQIHKQIVALSVKAHELARCIHAEVKPSYCDEVVNPLKELEKVEGEIDLAVAELFGLSLEDLREFEKLMAILSGEEPPEEPEEAGPVGEPIITISNTLLQPNTQNQLEIDVTNPQGTMLEINYELPWETGTFKIVEGKHIIQTPPLKPGKYQGRLEYTFNGVQKTLEITIEVMEQAGPKRRKTLQDTG
jgi:type II restriction/modification system DNA methylase subunit YeeA